MGDQRVHQGKQHAACYCCFLPSIFFLDPGNEAEASYWLLNTSLSGL